MMKRQLELRKEETRAIHESVRPIFAPDPSLIKHAGNVIRSKRNFHSYVKCRSRLMTRFFSLLSFAA